MKLLYLTGDKNRETLPEILREGGLELRSLKVYETRGSSRFEEELGEVVRGVDVGALLFIYRLRYGESRDVLC